MGWRTVLCCFVAAGLVFPPAITVAQQEPEDAAADASVWDEVQRLYGVAKSKGEQVPKDVYEWARRDLHSHGDWEYLVVEVPATPPAVVEGRLNELGTDRWECIWIHAREKKLQLVLKRPARSYLHNLPLSQLLKLLPGAGDPGGGD